MQPPRTALIGVGNTILRDDGAGVHLARRLRQGWSFSPAVAIHIVETGGLHLVDLLAGCEMAVLLDAIASEQPPGTVMILGKNELLRQAPPQGLTGHALGLKKALEFAEVTGTLPDHLFLVAIAPAVIAFGEHLSAQVATAMARYEQTTLTLLRTVGITMNINTGAIVHGAE